MKPYQGQPEIKEDSRNLESLDKNQLIHLVHVLEKKNALYKKKILDYKLKKQVAELNFLRKLTYFWDAPALVPASDSDKDIEKPEKITRTQSLPNLHV